MKIKGRKYTLITTTCTIMGHNYRNICEITVIDNTNKTHFPGRGMDIFFTTTSRLALGPTQLHIKWVLGVPSLEG
jgi:hypothetical protein